MKYYIGLITAFLFVGCIKEGSTSYRATIINPTMHTIECRPYYAGAVPPANVFKIGANDTLEIALGSDRGIVGRAGFNPKYFAGADSVLVVYDNLYSIIHYGNTPAVLNPRHYLYSSLRNIANQLSYEYTFTDHSKWFRSSNYKYIFTEQDYLDAK